MSTEQIAALQAEVSAAVSQAMVAIAGKYGPFGGGFVPPPVAMSFLHVLTVSEAAQFLRVSEAVVVAEAEAGRLPGRKIGTEWRFLEYSLAEWLRAGQQPNPPAQVKSSKERMLALAGLWKDDHTAEALVEEIYRHRKANPIGGD